MTVTGTIANGSALSGWHEPCTAVVRGVRATGTATHVDTDLGQYRLPPFIYLKAGDRISLVTNGNEVSRITKLLPRNTGGGVEPDYVTLFPQYQSSETIEIPPHKIQVIFRERRSQSDWEKAKILEQFHYRGQGLNKVVGRRTVLIAVSPSNGLLGYGVLSAPLPAARPRFQLFGTNFGEHLRSGLINKIVRIPRVVVHPEYRGIGLGPRIVRHLIEFAKTRWEISGNKPILMEVIASMTDYHEFFEAAGFVPFMATTGYKKGIAPRYGHGTWDARLNAEGYAFMGGQRAKPYLAYPLTEDVARKLRGNSRRTVRSGIVFHAPNQSPSKIVLDNVSVSYASSVGNSERNTEIREVFGIKSDKSTFQVLNCVSVAIEPFDIVLISGSSGTGKSTLLKLLAAQLNSKDVEIKGNLVLPEINAIGRLGETVDAKCSLVDQVGATMKSAIRLLNQVGLAEAHVYLKTPVQISDGQKFRFALAKLCDSGKQIWTSDEFCASLDPLTAAIVARGFRKAATMCGATAILAASHYSTFVDSLLPNTVIKLRWGEEPVVYKVRLFHQKTGKRLVITCQNLARTTLTGVRVAIRSRLAESRPITAIAELSPFSSSSKVIVDRSLLRKGDSICLISDQGVGDMLLFQ